MSTDIAKRSDRGEHGYFARGSKLASGNVYAKRMHELRRTILDATDPADVPAVMASLLKLAKGGDVTACRSRHQIFDKKVAGLRVKFQQ